MRFFSENLEPV